MSTCSFNQDSSCLSKGTETGFSIYNLDPIELRYRDATESIGCVEMLYCTSLVVLIGSGLTPGSSPRKVKLVNTQNKETICELNFATTVLSVKLNNQRMVVCLEKHIHIYDLATVNCLQVLSTSVNLKGLMSLSDHHTSYLAFPVAGTATAGEPEGEVVLYDTVALRLISQIKAHKKPVVAVEFSPSASLLATASETGTTYIFYLPAYLSHSYCSHPIHAIHAFYAYVLLLYIHSYISMHVKCARCINMSVPAIHLFAHVDGYPVLICAILGWCNIYITTHTSLYIHHYTGTVIRVFQVPTGQLLHSFRRGANPAAIFSLSFSQPFDSGTLFTVPMFTV